MSDGSANPPQVAAGAKLAGRYLVGGALGAGTMAYVVKAIDTYTGEEVACKLPLDTSVRTTEALLTQYRLFRKVRSPHLQSLHGIDRHDGTPFIVFEFVEGLDLESWAPGRPIEERLKALASIAETVSTLVKEGLEHGDLWAPNVLVRPSGRVLLIDPDSEQFGSSVSAGTQPRRPLIGPGARDHAGLRGIAEDIFAESERGAVPWLFRRFADSSSLEVEANDIVAAIRHALTLPNLPGETKIQDLAVGFRRKTTDERTMFVTCCKARDIAFLQTSAMLAQMADAFGLRMQAFAPLNGLAEGALLEDEIASAGQPRSRLHPRTATVVSPHGEMLRLLFEGKADIRRPWRDPGRVGLVDHGWIQVFRDGKPISSQRVELWLRHTVPELFVNEVGRYTVCGPAVWERAVRILVEDVLPGWAQPTPVALAAAPEPLWQHQAALKQWCESRKRLVPTWGKPDWHGAFTEMVFTSGIMWPRKKLEARLPSFFTVQASYDARLALVQRQAQELARTLGQHISPFYRLDVQVVDETDGRLKVVFEGGALSHTFEMDAATTAMRVKRLSRAPASTSSTPRTSSIPAVVHDSKVAAPRLTGKKGRPRQDR
jgi:hypothetical protein